MKKGGIVALIGAGFFVMVPLLMYTSYNNSEIRLKHAVTAQQKKNEAVFDNTWKILKQQAGVANQHKEAFRQIYADLMHGRYDSGGGQMMKWVQEHNPQFDSSLYGRLMTSIEAQRTTFTREQTRLIDLKREHDNLRETIPSSFFVGNRAPVEIIVVTSGQTEHTFETGREDNVDLFSE
jgi:hypothetical protein